MIINFLVIIQGIMIQETNGKIEKTKTGQTELAYMYLKEQIQNCTYLPGKEIFEKQLYEELEFGRTPIREALLTLKRENLIEIFPRKGMRIKEITVKDINELYQMRKLLEPSIAAEYCSLISKETLMNFEQKFLEDAQSNDTSLNADIAYYHLDVDFHTFIINATQNETLLTVYKNLMEKQFRLATFGAITKSSIRTRNFEQHQTIIAAMLQENKDLITESILNHLNYSLITSLNVIKNIKE